MDNNTNQSQSMDNRDAKRRPADTWKQNAGRAEAGKAQKLAAEGRMAAQESRNSARKDNADKAAAHGNESSAQGGSDGKSAASAGDGRNAGRNRHFRHGRRGNNQDRGRNRDQDFRGSGRNDRDQVHSRRRDGQPQDKRQGRRDEQSSQNGIRGGQNRPLNSQDSVNEDPGRNTGSTGKARSGQERVNDGREKAQSRRRFNQRQGRRQNENSAGRGEIKTGKVRAVSAVASSEEKAVLAEVTVITANAGEKPDLTAGVASIAGTTPGAERKASDAGTAYEAEAASESAVAAAPETDEKSASETAPETVENMLEAGEEPSVGTAPEADVDSAAEDVTETGKASALETVPEAGDNTAAENEPANRIYSEAGEGSDAENDSETSTGDYETETDSDADEDIAAESADGSAEAENTTDAASAAAGAEDTDDAAEAEGAYDAMKAEGAYDTAEPEDTDEDETDYIEEDRVGAGKPAKPVKLTRVIAVRFRTAGKAYYFSPGQYDVKRGQHVIVETTCGMEYGLCVCAPIELDLSGFKQPIREIIRIADEKDDVHMAENREKEKEAFHICKNKIQQHKLDMKLIDAEYTFDNSKIMFYFTADGRVDFRDLVKDLAGIFRTRIELRQIGVRDETRMLGGYGICGRPLCCASYLSDFAPVSIRMAKEQNLSLNPAKISGVCGRLMCCLKNEEEIYEELNKKLPKPGDEVEGNDGLRGEVESVNILRQKVRIIVDVNDEKELHDYDADQITIIRKRRRGQARTKLRDDAGRKGSTRSASNGNAPRGTGEAAGARSDNGNVSTGTGAAANTRPGSGSASRESDAAGNGTAGGAGMKDNHGRGSRNNRGRAPRGSAESDNAKK